MKKLFCLLLAVALLLVGCTELRETEKKEYDETPLMQELNLEANISITPLLYFFNESQTRLTAETREISVPPDGRKEAYVVQALIDGPETELLPVANGFALDYIEVMPDLINVYLGLEGRKSDDEIFNAKAAIAATLSDFTGKKNINILINGMQTAYMGMPTGVFKKLGGDLYEERTVLQGRSETENPDMEAALYFLDASEKYLLPETRRLVFKKKDYILTLVEQLIRGPEDTFNHKPVLDSTIKLLGYEIVEDEQGRKIAWLHFDKDPWAFTETFQDGRRLAVAALTYTITSFLPDIYGVKVVVGTMQSGSGVYTADHYRDLIGSSITIYLPGNNTSSLLVGTPRVIEQSVAYYPRTVLKELMRGPVESEDGVYPAMPDGISIGNVKNVYVANDILVIDFDNSVAETMDGVSEDKEFVMLYSIVDTMTSIEGIKRVQFLLDGERIDYLGEGNICLIDPLIKNPGIIKN